MKPSRLLKRIVSARNNVRFRDALALAEAVGFRVDRIEASHHILRHPKVVEMLNLQEVRGCAKPYQLRQLLDLVERYNLQIGGEE